MTLTELEQAADSFDQFMRGLGFYRNGSYYSGNGFYGSAHSLGQILKPKLAEILSPPVKDKTEEFNKLLDTYYKEDIKILDEIIKEYKQRKSGSGV